MTEAERVHNAQAIAGQRGYNGLLAILNATDADYASLTNSINNCTGAAQRMANVKLDNLNGQLTLMDSAWDALKTVNANLKLSIFAETKCHFSAVGTVVHTALFNNPTCRYEACQALIYQLVLGLTGENGKYNYSKAVHVYPPFSDIPCSAKNYKIAPALTKTTIGEEFNPELRALAEIATDVLGWINGFVQEHPALVKGIMAAVGAVGAGVVALIGVATVTNVLIPLMGALTAATPGVNIIMGVTAAVAGVVGVVTALATAADAGVPSVKELTEAARDMQDAMEEAGVSYKETATQTLATAEVASIYIDKLEEIEAATNGATEGNQEYHNILALLTRTVPELANDIDLTTDTINGGIEALRQHTEAWKKDAETQAYQEYINSLYDQYGEVMAESAENSIKLTQAQIKLETAEKNRDAALERMNELSVEAYENGTYLTQEYYELENALYGYNDEIYTAQREIKNLTKAIDADAEAVAAAEAEIESAQDAVNQLTGATEEQTEAEAEAARQTEELNNAIGSTMEQVQSLVAAYEDAYNAAYESISGQYAIWDEAAKVVEVSAGTINNALESQIAYWQDYNANLQSLTERSADIEGLSDVIASFADGSQDSVNAIAGLANASDEDLRAMVTNWQALQKEQEAAAGSVADLKTDFTATMDELQAELAEDIDAMDLGDEAAKAGKATLQGYIDGANAMLPQVQAAYAELASAAVNALGSSHAAAYNTARAKQAISTRRGYASGTNNAEPGWAMVGENGPELMFFNGGEQVLNAAETSAMQPKISSDIQMMTMAAQMMAMLNAHSGQGVGAISAELGGRGAPTNISVSVPIQVTGNAGPDTLEALRELRSSCQKKDGPKSSGPSFAPSCRI